MTEYKCHWWPDGGTPVLTAAVTLNADSRLEGAALALRRLVDLGCDITAPHAHIDMTEKNGSTRVVLVEEVLDWLDDPKQSLFVRREGLSTLSRAGGAPGIRSVRNVD